VRLSAAGEFENVNAIIARGGLNTVCTAAKCPNKHECFSRGTATFMILGGICTRNCAFCNVQTGKPLPPDPDEPRRVASAAAELKLRHVVVTSVTRDDLQDGGAGFFAATINAVRIALPEATVEVLTPDFQGCTNDVATVLDAAPDVFNHNLETVERLQGSIRTRANYSRSLDVLRFASGWRPKLTVKSGLMAGLGETDDELFVSMRDLLEAGCESLTIGQYLAPSKTHAHVDRFVEPSMFEEYGRRATAMGFKAVASGPLVRSSYMADKMLGRNK